MPQGLGSAGLMGLTHNANKRESARADLQTYSQMYALKQAEDAKNQQAIAQEQAYYDQIRAQADELLAPDKKRINEKAKSIQAEIRSKIKLFGGNTSKFMSNGGMQMIGDYKNNVLNSDELAIFKQNKINLERIIDAKNKNLGHRLTPQDQMSLEQYEKTGRGEITYSGLMNEIEIPESNLFDYGTQISPLDIVMTGSNKMKLLNNYMLENPDKEPPNPETKEGMLALVSYAHTKGYGGRGSNISKMQYAGYGRGNNNTPKTPKEDKEVTWSGTLATVMSSKAQVSIDNINDSSFGNEGLLDALIGDNFVTNWNVKATQNPSVLNFIGDRIGLDADNGYRLRGARKVSDRLTVPLWESAFGNQYEIEGNKIKGLEINSGMRAFKADGSKVDEDVSSGTYQMMGTALAWETIDSEGNPRLVVDGVSEEGKLDVDRTNDLYKTDEGANRPTGTPTMVIMVKDKDNYYDDDYYIQIPYGDATSQMFVRDKLGEMNNITKISDEQIQNQGIVNQAEMEASATVDGVINKEIDLNPREFNSPLFELQNNNYNQKSSSNMRNSLRKGFYLASQDMFGTDLGSAIEEDKFNELVESLGLLQDMRDTRISDTQLLNKFLTALGTDTQNNHTFIEKMKNYITAINTQKQ